MSILHALFIPHNAVADHSADQYADEVADKVVNVEASAENELQDLAGKRYHDACTQEAFAAFYLRYKRQKEAHRDEHCDVADKHLFDPTAQR